MIRNHSERLFIEKNILTALFEVFFRLIQCKIMLKILKYPKKKIYIKMKIDV